MLLDSEQVVKYRVVDKHGNEVAIKDTHMLAEMYINTLPDEVKEGCKVVPITEDGKQLLFG